MARVAQSRNLKGFNWLTKKRVTYRRHVGKERLELKRQAFQERKERIALKKLEAEERTADARIAAAQRKIETAGKKTDAGGMAESRFEAMKARMESEIAKQEEYKTAARARAGNPCAQTRKSTVTDRAKRYRANQRTCKPAGGKKCKLCGAKSDVMVDHIDGNESNGRKSNLRWLCRSCNTVLGAEMSRSGQGRRTVQYNPGGAKTLWEYTQAVLQHTRKAHDAAGRIIHETPKSRRREFASQIWAARQGRGTASPGSASAGHDEPEWVSNPERSTEYQLGYSLGQRDRETASLRRTSAELEATFRAKFDPARASTLMFAEGYEAGYGVAAENPNRGEPFRYKGVTITPVPPTFDRYDVALPSGTIRLSSIQDAKDWVTRQPQKSRWNPRRSDWGYGVYAQDTRSAFQSSNQVAFFSSAREAKKLAENHNNELKATGRWYGQVEPHYHVRKAIREIGNPEPGDNAEYEQSKRIAELFHGRPVKEEITVTESIREHDWLWRIGPLVKLKIRTLTKRNATLPFHQTEEGMVHLFCSPDGRQFYLRGGDQELDLKALDMGPGSDWFRDHMIIGEAKEITYRDKKKFHKFKLTEYYHKLGEETKKKPMLAYGAFANKMQIVGGQYRVETEDLVDGMSPGIVN
jgi:hypothetical protein